jgi:hypothetical protein
MNTTTKVIIMLLLIAFSNLTALEENVFTPIEGIGYVLGFTSDYSTLFGSSANFVGLAKWTEAEGFEIIDPSFQPENYSDNGYVAGSLNQVAGYINPEGEYVEIGNFEEGVQEGDFVSTAYAVNSDGTIFSGMGFLDAMSVNPFAWSEEEGFVNLMPGDVSGRVNISNAAGDIFYGWADNENYVRSPVKWQNGETEVLPTINDTGSGEVMGISQDGSYLCGLSSDLGAVWHDGEVLGGGVSEPMWATVYSKVSNTGIAVGVERNFPMMIQNGVIWSAETGHLTVEEYFQLYGIEIPTDYDIDFCSYVSPDGTLFAGSAYDLNTYEKVAWYVQINGISQIQGTVTLNGGEGNIEDVVITNGIVSTSPDASGQYSLSVAAGTYDLTAVLNGYNLATVTNVEVGESEVISDIDFILEPFENPATIEGYVSLYTYEGNIFDVEISVGDFTTNPAADGYYIITVPAGEYSITANLANHIGDVVETQNYAANQTYSQDLVVYMDGLMISVNGFVEAEESGNIGKGKVQLGENSYFIWEDGQYGHSATIGDYEMLCYVPGFELETAEISLTLEDFAEGIVQNFELERDFYSVNNLSFEQSLAWNAPLGMDATFEDFEFYETEDDIVDGHPFWYRVYDYQGSTAQVAENPVNQTKALKFDGTDGVIDDLVMSLGQTLEGAYDVDFEIYIPEGYSAHYDLLHSLYNITMSLEVFFREDGTMEVLHAGQQTDFTFQHDQWIHISNSVNLDTNEAALIVNGETILDYQWNIESTTGEYLDWAYLNWLNISTDPRPDSGETGLFYIDNVAINAQENPGEEDCVYNVYLDDMTNPVANQIEANSYQFEDLAVGTYTAGVQAVYPTGEVSTIQYHTFYYGGPEQILPPTNLAVNEDVLVSWDAPQRDLSGYNLYLDDELIAEGITDTEYQLTNLEAGTYTVAVSAIYNATEESEAISLEFTYDPVSSEEEMLFVNQLKGNYPNPFNPTTNISFSLASEADVELKIFNSKGQLIDHLIKDDLAAGEHSIIWNGRDNSGKEVATGVYFYQLQTADFRAMKKMILMK